MISNDILSLVGKELQDIENDLCKTLNSNIPTINKLIEDTMKSGGKRIRPIFLALTAGMCGYHGDLTVKIGTILEHIHTASLLHDDVIDGALYRRGKDSANKLYGNNIAVLSGDYLYTNAFVNITNLPNKEFAYILTNAVAAMTEGEILQLTKTGDTNINMTDYMWIIYGKTAALFSAACECSAVLGNIHESLRKEIINFGCNVGYAFQLKDDLLDYFGDEQSTGKKPGTDLCEKKLTLPLILLLKEVSNKEKKELAACINSDENVDKRLAEMLGLLKKHNIEEKSDALVKSHINTALTILDKFPASPYNEALKQLTSELDRRNS